MGQAKRRGTFEQRLQQVIEKKSQEVKHVIPVELQEANNKPVVVVGRHRPCSPILVAALIAALSGGITNYGTSKETWNI